MQFSLCRQTEDEHFETIASPRVNDMGLRQYSRGCSGMYSSNEAALPWLNRAINRLPRQRTTLRARLLRYGFALATVAAAWFSRDFIGRPDLGLPLLTFFSAAALSTVIVGIGPGLLASALGMALGTWLYMPPYHAFSFEFASGNVLSNVLFAFNEALLCLALKAMQVHRDKYQANRALLAAVVEATPDAIYVKNRDGAYQYCNTAAAQRTGAQAEHILGRRAEELFPAEESRPMREEDLAVMNAGQIMNFENTLHDHNGEPRVWLSTKGPLRDEHGQMRGIFGIDRDITELRRAEEETRLVARVFDMAAEGIVITDPMKRILNTNEAFTTLTGYAREEVIGQGLSLLNSGRHDQDFYAAMWHALLKSGKWEGEIWNRRKNGELHLEWLSISTVKDAQGRVLNYIAVFRDITVVRGSQQRMDFLATHDELTALPNRILLIDRLQLAVKRAIRTDQRLAVLLIDLDNFKDINDSLGHHHGDELLLQAAGRLTECVRREDTVARMGGDEFAILLENSDKETVTHTAERILARLAKGFQLGGQACHVSASIGVSVFPDDATEQGELLSHADSAMYRAKESGRNAWRFFSEEMAERSRKRLATERGLRRALLNDELFIEYQPQVDLANGRLIGAEALIRWRCEGRIVPPLEFIPVAEESHLIVEIGEWVVATVCRQLHVWQAQGHTPFNVSVNLAARHFQQADMVERLCHIVRSSGIDAQRICLEITEGALENVDVAMKMLKEFEAFGFAISVDDFGTGFSSLSYLKRFPLHELKVDRSFVSGIVDDRDDAAITSAIVALADNLTLRVVAEGIETDAQRRALQGMGCRIGQGYFFSRPLTAERFDEWLQTRTEAHA